MEEEQPLEANKGRDNDGDDGTASGSASEESASSGQACSGLLHPVTPERHSKRSTERPASPETPELVEGVFFTSPGTPELVEGVFFAEENLPGPIPPRLVVEVAADPASCCGTICSGKNIVPLLPRNAPEKGKARRSAFRFGAWIVLASLVGFWSGRSASSFVKRQSLWMGTPLLPEESSMDAMRMRRQEEHFARSPATLRERRARAAWETTRQRPEERERRKRFAEFVVHPVLLTTRPVPRSIALAVDSGPSAERDAGNEMARDLLSEILVYDAIERATVVFVAGSDARRTHGGSQGSCPELLAGLLGASGRQDSLDLDCLYVDPCETNPWEHLRTSGAPAHHDVSIVLAGRWDDPASGDRTCGYHTRWEEDLYAATDGVAVKRVGKTYPLDHPSRKPRGGSGKGGTTNIDRIEHFFVDPELENHWSSPFAHVTDYDVFEAMGIATNLAVAFRSHRHGYPNWRSTEAGYKLAMKQRWRGGRFQDGEEHGVRYFDSAEMVRIQRPSKHSAVSSCEHYEDLIPEGDLFQEDEEFYCLDGFDPHYPNVPSRNFYVGQSTVGANAGRGVFAAVDLVTESYIMLENAIHLVSFSPGGSGMVEQMLHRFCLPDRTERPGRKRAELDSFHCIVQIYADAYGYRNSWSGIEINSGIGTFINHGCNGTSNIGFDYELTEFDIVPDGHDPNPEAFDIPLEFKNGKSYNPNYDRHEGLEHIDATERPIEAHEELLDNYIAMGGATYFLAQAVALKRQCSGTKGTVRTYERGTSTHRYDVMGSRYATDPDKGRG